MRSTTAFTLSMFISFLQRSSRSFSPKSADLVLFVHYRQVCHKKKNMPKTLACSHRTPSASPPKLQQLGGCLDFGLFVLVHVSVHPHSGQVWHTQTNKLIEMGEKTIIGGPAVDGTKTYIIDESQIHHIWFNRKLKFKYYQSLEGPSDHMSLFYIGDLTNLIKGDPQGQVVKKPTWYIYTLWWRVVGNQNTNDYIYIIYIYANTMNLQDIS